LVASVSGSVATTLGASGFVTSTTLSRSEPRTYAFPEPIGGIVGVQSICGLEVVGHAVGIEIVGAGYGEAHNG
jgi:hypothetical protein